MKENRALLWSCQRPGRTDTHYLFGTMHVRASDAHLFLQHIIPYLGEIDQYAAEYDLREEVPPLPQQHFDLLDQMGPKVFTKTQAIIKKATGIDLIHFRYYHPTLTQGLIDASFFSNDHALPLDQVLWNQAGVLGCSRYGLESLSDQMTFLQSIPTDQAIKSIKDVARSICTYRRQANNMLRWYRAQRVELIYQKARKGLGKQRKLLLFHRNFQMVQRFQALSEDGSIMAGVGAGHLGGNQGMIALLKKKHWKVKPIYFEV